MHAAELFNVILVYEDQASALRGLALYQRLVTQLGGDSDFNLNVWKFAVLGVGRLDEISSGQAAEADLIIVCTRDEAEPTAEVQEWFQHWAEAKGQSDCAMAVLGASATAGPESSATPGFFHGLAQRGGISYFSPAAHADSAKRAAGCGWFPHQPHGTGADACFDNDRRNAPSCLSQPSSRIV